MIPDEKELEEKLKLDVNYRELLLEAQKADRRTLAERALTRRDHFAAMAMQGLLAGRMDAGIYTVEELAVSYADDLIKELDKEENKNGGV